MIVHGGITWWHFIILTHSHLPQWMLQDPSAATNIYISAESKEDDIDGNLQESLLGTICLAKEADNV